MKRNNSPILIIVIILIVLCLCASSIACAITAGAALFITSSSQATETLSTLPADTELPAEDALSPDTTAAMDTIEAQVAEIRGLPILAQVPRQLLNPTQLSEKVRTEFFADYSAEDAAKDQQILSMLGLLSPDFDLLQFYTELYSEQIAGYYDEEAQAMFVVRGERFGGVERDTYAHEFTHALQDQHFDFSGQLGYSEDACEGDSERCAALQALIEGDATLTEMAWLESHGTPQDFQDIQRFYSSFESPVFDSAPAYMQEDFVFAYQQGYTFVESLYDQGAYAAVNQAYTDQLLLSTEQIMHPERYPDDAPIAVNLPIQASSLGAGWEESEREVLGEWFTWLLLARPDDPAARQDDLLVSQACEGWGGDSYAVFENAGTDEQMLVVRYQWDSTSDANQAFDAFETYLQLRFGAPDAGDTYAGNGYFSQLRQEDPSTFTWIITESRSGLDAVLSALP